MIDFLSHLSPKRTRSTPTARRREPIGTSRTRAVPRTTTITAKAASAIPVPAKALFQLIVTPITRTIVNASTNSTAEARNAARKMARRFELTQSPQLAGSLQAHHTIPDQRKPVHPSDNVRSLD